MSWSTIKGSRCFLEQET